MVVEADAIADVEHRERFGGVDRVQEIQSGADRVGDLVKVGVQGAGGDLVKQELLGVGGGRRPAGGAGYWELRGRSLTLALAGSFAHALKDRARPGRSGRVTSAGSGGGQPRLSGGQGGERVDRPLSVFAGGGEVGADREEPLSALRRAPASGDLLLQLDHPDVALGQIVVKRDPQVGSKAQHL